MNAVIHCRRKNDKLVFRLWHRAQDEYISPELSEEELMPFILQETVRETIALVFAETPERIERAKQNGTSSQRDDPSDLNGPWEEE